MGDGYSAGGTVVKKGNRRKLKLQFRLTLMFSLLVGATCLIFLAVGVRREARDLVADADYNLLLAGEFSGELLGPGYHDSIADGTSVAPAEYRRIVARNDSLCHRLGLQYLWSVLQVDGRLVFTSATHSDINDPASPCASFFEAHKDPASFERALLAGTKPVFSSFRNEWGEGRMVLLPRKDSQGRTYIIGTSIQLAKLDATIWSAVLVLLGIGLSVFAAAAIAIPFIVLPTTRRIETLAKAADHMATGDLDFPLEPVKDLELKILAGSLDTMRQSLKSRMAELEVAADWHRAILQAAMDGYLLVDTQGHIMEANAAYCQMSGYEPGELQGVPASVINAEETASETVAHIQKVIDLGEERAETIHRRKDGSLFDVDISIQYRPEAGGRFVVFVRDITERKRAERRLHQDLEEKGVVLREVHHRVGNNLNVMSDLIDMQVSAIRTPDEAIAGFRKNRNRIMAMALVHEELNMAKDLASIDMGGYIERLSKGLMASRSAGEAIRVSAEVDDIVLGVSSSIPCALIINELVTNAFTHSFPEGKKGAVHIRFREMDDSSLELSVSDNGLGWPYAKNATYNDALGLTMVWNLAEQLGGTHDYNAGNGTTCRIRFPKGVLV
jgi:PAS domain S-box-containing protein